MSWNDPPQGAIALGHDTFYTKLFQNGVWVGITEWHREGDGYEAGSVGFTGRFDHPTTWELISEDPLTLSPSIACGQCGHHGFIRDGRWVPA